MVRHYMSRSDRRWRAVCPFTASREKSFGAGIFRGGKRDTKLCREYKVPFIINDNVDLALEIDADGVHVGQDDMEAGEVRKRLGEDKIIGVSAHSVEEALRAENAGQLTLAPVLCLEAARKRCGNVRS